MASGREKPNVGSEKPTDVTESRLCILKTALAPETVAFQTRTGYRPRHVRDRLSSPPFNALSH